MDVGEDLLRTLRNRKWSMKENGGGLYERRTERQSSQIQ